MRYGFIGLGTMGVPIAQHMIDAGHALLVWNRSPDKYRQLRGAEPVDSVKALFDLCETVFLGLSSEEAIDQVFERDNLGCSPYFPGHIIVNFGTFSAAYSAGLAQSISAAGGRYVESPVSGSRRPAEQGQLVAMLAGDADSVSQVEPLIKLACRTVVYCGDVPSALLMKHATNMLLLPILVGIAEASAFARRSQLDLNLFSSILDGGQMSCDLLRAKLPKILDDDYSPHSAIKNVLMSGSHTVQSARQVSHAAPLTELCCRLLQQAIDQGLGEEDVLALEKVIGIE